MRLWIFMIAVLASSPAIAQEQPSSWMLLLRTDAGAAFSPTTYESGNECGMIANQIEDHTTYRAECLPAHYTEGQVAEYEAAQKADVEKAKQRADEIDKQRPALEAERQGILNDKIKRNTLRYIERLQEIEVLIGPPMN